MDNRLQELKFALQLLGLPISGQLHMVEDDCLRVRILAQEFAASHRAVRTEADALLTPAQTAALTELDNQLTNVGQRSHPALCSELALRRSADWRQVRALAREALVHFRWTLEFPPHGVTESKAWLN